MNVTDTGGAAVDTTQNTTGSNVSSDQFSNFPDAENSPGALHDCSYGDPFRAARCKLVVTAILSGRRLRPQRTTTFWTA